MQDAYTPVVFLRYAYQLRAVMVDNRPWFVAEDFARLIGALRPYRLPQRVDPHHRRALFLLHQSGAREEVEVISDAGAYQALYRFHHPEHRAISQWLSEQVVPTLHDRHRDAEATPRRAYMCWANQPINVLSWQGDVWINRQDLPVFLASLDEPALRTDASWRQAPW